MKCFYCDACNIDTKNIICDRCNIVTKCRYENAFSLFGLEKDFNIDTQKLEEQYNNLQVNVHPDYYIGKKDFEKKRAMQHSMHINDCFEILSDKRKRAIYLIETLQKQKLDENEITQNKNIPADYFEIVENLKSKENEAAKADIKDRIKANYKDFKNHISKKDIKSAKEKVIQIVFYENLIK